MMSRTMERPLAHTVLEFTSSVLLCCGAGIVGGFVFGVLHASTEHAWFYLLRALEARGLIRRLAPCIQVTRLQASREDFFSVSIPLMLLGALMFAGRVNYYNNSRMSLDITGGLVFTWVLMVLHDTFFWVVHSSMHHFKRAYQVVHQLHHATGGDITVFSTAYGEVLEVALFFLPFYSMVMLWIYCKEEWNPFHFVLVIWVVNNVNILGHSGYQLPAWVYLPASLGLLLTPLTQRPLHHYIHHLDPRVNRSLYFTWCDRLGGTFRDTHPKVLQDNIE